MWLVVAVSHWLSPLPAASLVQLAPLTDTPPGVPLADPELVATVFAPTDDAFLAAIEALNTTAEALLANTVRRCRTCG